MATKVYHYDGSTMANKSVVCDTTIQLGASWMQTQRGNILRTGELSMQRHIPKCWFARLRRSRRMHSFVSVFFSRLLWKSSVSPPLSDVHQECTADANGNISLNTWRVARRKRWTNFGHTFILTSCINSVAAYEMNGKVISAMGIWNSPK